MTSYHRPSLSLSHARARTHTHNTHARTHVCLTPASSPLPRYGHRFPVCALAPTAIPASKLSIPLSRLSIELVAKKDVVKMPPMRDELAADCCGGKCCDYTPVGEIVVLKVRV